MPLGSSLNSRSPTGGPDGLLGSWAFLALHLSLVRLFHSSVHTALLCQPGTHTYGCFQDSARAIASMKPFLTACFLFQLCPKQTSGIIPVFLYSSLRINLDHILFISPGYSLINSGYSINNRHREEGCLLTW